MTKKVQNDKKLCPLCFISQEPYVTWLSLMVHMCKMIISPDVFFTFSKFWFFWLLGGLKKQKTVQNDKKFLPPCFMSQEPYIIWLSFMVYMCKIMIYQGVFLSFSKFWFPGFSGAWKGNKWPRMTKNSACLTPYLRNRTSYDCNFWNTCVKWWSKKS